MKMHKKTGQAGFSLLELLIAMTLMLILLSIVSTLVAQAMSVRARESQRADALVSVQAALNVISREIANSGFGLGSGTNNRVSNNGIVVADSNASRIHLRSNMINTGDRANPQTALLTDEPGEDITYFLDPDTRSIVRYDANLNETSVIVNRISNLQFTYYNYTTGSSAFTETTTPAPNTGRVRITVTVELERVVGQPDSTVSFTSDVTLRNSQYMLRQY